MIKFGPSGNSKRFYDDGHVSTTDAPKWCADQGLNAYEYSFCRGINISDEKAVAIGELAKQFGVALSVHAPYYINFANSSDEMAEKSYAYVIRSGLKAKQFGATRVVFHPSSVGKMIREDAVALTKVRLQVLAERIRENGLDDLWFCPETMGKINQIGDVAEVADFCTVADFYLPTIDFGHINARTYGSLKTEENFDNLISTVQNKLGRERTEQIHVHFSKIEYSNGGEVRHLTFADTFYGPEFLPLAKVLVKRNLHPTVICESDGTQADDAITMKSIYESVLSGETK